MEAKRDQNQVPTLIAASREDGRTTIALIADPITHRLKTLQVTTGSDLSGDEAKRDQNQVTSMLATSETDGLTPVPLYAEPITQKLLTKS